mmetsp:Transcript_4655/g.15519  ORF Transcript_4655/g.15519 Transcript_4655/m.15519 type:complete len:277 (+) Transcript_4655:818-1648(+)
MARCFAFVSSSSFFWEAICSAWVGAEPCMAQLEEKPDAFLFLFFSALARDASSASLGVYAPSHTGTLRVNASNEAYEDAASPLSCFNSYCRGGDDVLAWDAFLVRSSRKSKSISVSPGAHNESTSTNPAAVPATQTRGKLEYRHATCDPSSIRAKGCRHLFHKITPRSAPPVTIRFGSPGTIVTAPTAAFVFPNPCLFTKGASPVARFHNTTVPNSVPNTKSSPSNALEVGVPCPISASASLSAPPSPVATSRTATTGFLILVFLKAFFGFCGTEF